MTLRWIDYEKSGYVWLIFVFVSEHTGYYLIYNKCEIVGIAEWVQIIIGVNICNYG